VHEHGAKEMMQAVQVIIERLKSHPEEFFGGIDEHKALGMTRPKFYDVTDKIDNLLTEPQDGHVHRLWYLEPEEKAALTAAYKEARRARFEAKVFHTLLTAQEPEEFSTVTYKPGMTLTSSGGLGVGTSLPSKIIAPQNMLAKAQQILEQEFDRQYAKNSNP
jgi:hypothetical protein